MTGSKTFRFLGIVLFVTIWTALPLETNGNGFEDIRCKCTCSKMKDVRSVFHNATDPEDCDCDHVVRPLAPTVPCSLCKCQTEQRNTLTIKVLVIVFIIIMFFLFGYMVFLVCLDPLLQKCFPCEQRPDMEEVNMDDFSQLPEDPDKLTQFQPIEPFPMSAKRRSIIDIVSQEQRKWKIAVEEQRRNIYDRHSVLA